jgi:hypothetical protein
MDFTYKTKEVQEALTVDYRILRELRLNGVLRPGKHFCYRGLGVKNPRMLWNIEATQAALTEWSTRQLITSPETIQ